MYDSIIILGATATGKTGLAISLAKILNTEIINADSMYIYKGLSIGTAKPTYAEMQGVKHHIIDVANPDEEFNVVNYREKARPIINNFLSNNIIPIIVGGTGFYIDSLIKNYSYGNAVHNTTLREELQEILKKNGSEYLYNMLANIDPKSASKLHINDTVRIIRAIEIARTSNNLKSDNNNKGEVILKNPLIIGLDIARDILYKRINARVDTMIENGLINEVNKLYERGLRPETHQSMRGIGYKEIVDYIESNTDLTTAIDKIKQHTRNYAKRQLTWFRRNPNIHWFDPMQLSNNDICNEIIKILKT